MEAALIQLAKQSSSIDAVLIVGFISIATVLIKARKEDSKAKIIGIRWIGCLTAFTLLMRAIMYFVDLYVQIEGLIK